MSGRSATDSVIPGRCAVSVGRPDIALPTGWSWVALSDIARLESGHTPSREHPEYWGGDIAWIGIKDARQHDGGVINETLQTVTQAGIDNSAARLLPAGTVCLSRTASVGYTVILGKPMATSQDFVNWVCTEAVDPRFLQYALMAEGPEGLRKFGEGTTHTTIYYPEVKAFHVALPPVPEQRRIVAKLDELRTRSRRAREALADVPAMLEQLKQSILAAAFCGELTVSWRVANPEVEPASALLARIQDAQRVRWEKTKPKRKYVAPAGADVRHLPDLPVGWEWTTLGHLIHGFEAGKSPQAESRPAVGDERGVIKVSAVTWGRFNPDENKALPPNYVADPRCMIRAGDLLISRANTPELVGAVVLVDKDHPRLMLSDKILRVLQCAEVDPTFLLHALRGSYVRAAFEEDATGTSDSMRNLSQPKIASAPIPLPPLDEQIELARRLKEGLNLVKDSANIATAALVDVASLDQTVLAKAFRGELVPQDPNDEPADALIARIHAALVEPIRPARRGRTATIDAER